MGGETFMGLMQDVLLLTLEQRAQLRTRLDAQETQQQVCAFIELPRSAAPPCCPRGQSSCVLRHGQVSGVQR